MAETLVKRSEKLPFYGVPGASGGEATFTRMKFFDEVSQSKNPTEYSRQYIDMEIEETDVVGYAPSISYSFDDHTNNAVLEDIKTITDDELVGDATVREIVIVDLTKQGKTAGAFVARKRSWAIIPDSEGDDMESYGYSGSMKAKTAVIKGEATSTDGWQTLTFAEDTEE